MDDLISRQVAIDVLKKAYWDKDIQSARNDPCIVDAMTDWSIRQIKCLPSAQPEQQKTGQWKTRYEGSLHYCSECGWALMDTESGETPYMGTDFNRSNEERWTCCPGWCGWLMNFCPNCGAKMEVEQ